MTTLTAAAELVVLLDEDGSPIGSADKTEVHHLDTPLHLAFSCYVFDDAGRFLLTRRALSKRVWPGVWTNTACGHPAPGEALEDAVVRRVEQELGLVVSDVEVVLPDYRYRTPPFQGVVENEVCPVFRARATTDPQPDPAEVEQWRWAAWPEVVRLARADAVDAWSWWTKDQLRELTALPGWGA